MKRLSQLALKGLANNSFAWIETLLVTFGSIYVWISYDANTLSYEHNGLLSNDQTFFWPLIGPLLIALRYGFAKGFTCALVTSVTSAYFLQVTNQLDTYPLALAIGTIIVAMLAGEFHDHWDNINRRHQLDEQYMNQKLESFTQSYHLLKVSHDQLEKQTAGQTVSLRASISALQKLAVEYPEQRIEQIASPFMSILAETAGLEVAGIYQVLNGTIQPKALATIGDQHNLNPHDPMLKDMLQTQKVLSPADITALQSHQSQYQLCIPMVDSFGEIQAAVAAEKAKFFMLTPANVSLVALIANYTADLLSHKVTTPILTEQQGHLFHQHLKNMIKHNTLYGADSAIVACIDRSGNAETSLMRAVNYRRGADIYWSCKNPQNQPALTVLLPLTNVYEAGQYANRLQQILQAQLGDNATQFDIIGPYSINKNREDITALINHFGVYDEEMVDVANNTL
ncbi:PelD GGDEF domain-containing protein [Thaumasiovibrio sp. DFM-14]|uniref:PelD GGDEF domain-containing protein n=1 Tax=Thaumasiovibrio sp. DFM-14 TaxID=3384792 RepID=UPI0039A0010C